MPFFSGLRAARFVALAPGLTDNCEDYTTVTHVHPVLLSSAAVPEPPDPSRFFEDLCRDFAAGSWEGTSQPYVGPAVLTPSSAMIAAETAASSSEGASQPYVDPAVLSPSSAMIAAVTAAGSSEGALQLYVGPAVLTPSSAMIEAETAAGSLEGASQPYVGPAVLTPTSAMIPAGLRGMEATWGRWSGANYFFEDLMETLVVDYIPMPIFVLEVDIQVGVNLA
ncbi:hypothetical protein V5799_019835 [Amblyomma americanum]|uniref:Uncharacterized protein n=1 Tax=Amblyomma americanum TaxID=6943 RepID=A0AAQ4EW59_AMBAM